jgi:hypothetical protein
MCRNPAYYKASLVKVKGIFVKDTVRLLCALNKVKLGANYL